MSRYCFRVKSRTRVSDTDRAPTCCRRGVDRIARGRDARKLLLFIRPWISPIRIALFMFYYYSRESLECVFFFGENVRFCFSRNVYARRKRNFGRQKENRFFFFFFHPRSTITLLLLLGSKSAHVSRNINIFFHIYLFP